MMKTLRIASIALCALLLVLPSLAMPFFESDDGGAENRYLADYPLLVDNEDGLNPRFDADFEDWLCDRFAFRPQVIRANALLNYRLLRTSANDDVVVGRGDWLYFGETVPDYTGEGALNAAEAEAISENLRLLSDGLAAQGVRLYVAIIPNKSTVYPQYMPARYAMRQGDGNIAAMRDICEGLSIPWIDLMTPLREAADGEALIYLKTDTHWNDLGAAIAAQTILRAMGREATGYSVHGEADFSGGDLARLMGAPEDLTERQPNVIPDRSLPDEDFSLHRLRCSGDGEGTLLVYRDSFGTAIGPWLAVAYGNAELRWEYPLDGTRPCDDALLLLCERNLREYLLETPLVEYDSDLDAPDRNEPIDEGYVPIDGDDDFFRDDEPAEDDVYGEIEDDEGFLRDGHIDEGYVPIDGDDDFFKDDEETPGDEDIAMTRRADDGI